MIRKGPPASYNHNHTDHANSLEALTKAENTKQLALPSIEFFNDNPEFDPAILIIQLTNK